MLTPEVAARNRLPELFLTSGGCMQRSTRRARY